MGVHRTGDGKHVPPLIQRQSGGDQRARLGRSFSHQDAQTQAADDAVSAGKAGCVGLFPRWIFADGGTAVQNGAQQAGVFGRITLINGRSEHGHGGCVALDGAVVSGRIDTCGHARHHDHTGAAQLKGNALGDDDAVRGCSSLSHHCHSRQTVEVGPSAPNIEYQRRIIDIPQPIGIVLVPDGQNADILEPAPAQNQVGRGKTAVFQPFLLALLQLDAAGDLFVGSLPHGLCRAEHFQQPNALLGRNTGNFGHPQQILQVGILLHRRISHMRMPAATPALRDSALWMGTITEPVQQAMVSGDTP